MVETIKGFRTIFTPPDGENIVATAVYRGRLLIATDRYIYEWDGDTETVQRLQFATVSPTDEKQMVLASERAHPFGC